MRKGTCLSLHYGFKPHTSRYLSGFDKVWIIGARTEHAHPSRYYAAYGEVEIIKDAQTREQVGSLVRARQSMPSTVLWAEGRYILAKQLHLPRAGFEFARDKVEER
jgi:hypothetical protein